jgi:hypothetical protein
VPKGVVPESAQKSTRAPSIISGGWTIAVSIARAPSIEALWELRKALAVIFLGTRIHRERDLAASAVDASG